MGLRFRGEKFRRYDHIPGKFGGLPFLGNTIDIIADMPGYQTKMYEQYGNVVKGYGIGNITVMLFGPDAAELFFYDKENIMSTEKGFFTVYEFFPRGLLFRDFDDHTLHRRIMQTAFVPDALSHYTETLNQRVKNYVTAFTPDKVILYNPDIVQYLLQAAAEVFMGITVLDIAEYIGREFRYCIDGTSEPFRLNIPGTKFHRCKKGRANLEQFLKEQIEIAQKKENRKDMLAILCNAQDDNGRMFTEDEIIDHMIFLMFAAHDTLSGQLSTMIYYLAKNQDWQERLRDECKSLGISADDDLPYEELGKLIRVEWALYEALRLFPPVPITARYNINEVEISGVRIPKNTILNFAMNHLHRMESLYSNPLEWDPMRFSQQRSEHTKHRCAFIPFGAGPHRCIGMNYAKIQIKVMIYHLLMRYRIELESDYECPMAYKPLTTAVNGLPIILRKI